MKAVYRYQQDFGRQGDLGGVFLATPEEVKKAMGREVHLGEMFGKYSEVYALIDSSTITLITDNQEVVNIFEQYELATGTNPLDDFYADEEEEKVYDDGYQPEEEE